MTEISQGNTVLVSAIVRACSATDDLGRKKERELIRDMYLGMQNQRGNSLICERKTHVSALSQLQGLADMYEDDKKYLDAKELRMQLVQKYRDFELVDDLEYRDLLDKVAPYFVRDYSVAVAKRDQEAMAKISDKWALVSEGVELLAVAASASKTMTISAEKLLVMGGREKLEAILRA